MRWLTGIRVVKAFAQEKREVERFRRSNDLIVRANDRVNAVWTFFWPLIVLLNQVGLLIVWGFGAWLVYQQQTLFYGRRTFASEYEHAPDFVALMRGFGVAAVDLDRALDPERALAAALGTPGPCRVHALPFRPC